MDTVNAVLPMPSSAVVKSSSNFGLISVQTKAFNPDFSAQVFEKARMVTLNRAMKLAPEMTFGEAAVLFVDLLTLHLPGSNARYLAPRTLAGLKEYAWALNKLFEAVPLKDIEWWKIHAYHEARAKNEGGLWKSPAGANKILQEVSMLRRVMIRAGAWTPEHDANYVPLRYIESDIPCALTPEEQMRWLNTSGQKPEWRLVYLYSVVAFATAVNHIEGRQLRRADVNLFNEYLEVRSGSAKNRYRIRTIPLDLDSQARWALERLLERARELGSIAPSHYVYPFMGQDRSYDPTKPMTSHGLSRHWHEVAEAAGLKGFCPKDTRHTALTRWAESGMAIHVIMSMAGHINERMQRHYIAISEQAKRKAMRSVTAISNNSWKQTGVQ